MPLLRLFRSSWGLDLKSNPTKVFRTIRGLGYSGIEGSLLDFGDNLEQRQNAVLAAAAEDLQIILSAYSSWHSYMGPFESNKSVEDHITALTSELEEISRVVECCPSSSKTVVHVNAHSGSDTWSEKEGVKYFSLVQENIQSFGKSIPSVSHETHRGRYLCCPFITCRLLEHVPDLRLTSDFSHWVVKTERLLDTPEETEFLRDNIVPNIDHIHARVGTPQSPQVANLDDPRVSRAVSRHYDWWRDIVTNKRRAFVDEEDSYITATIEYGPVEEDERGEYVGYPQMLPHSHHTNLHPQYPSLDHETIIESAQRGFAKKYGEWCRDIA